METAKLPRVISAGVVGLENPLPAGLEAELCRRRPGLWMSSDWVLPLLPLTCAAPRRSPPEHPPSSPSGLFFRRAAAFFVCTCPCASAAAWSNPRGRHTANPESSRLNNHGHWDRRAASAPRGMWAPELAPASEGHTEKSQARGCLRLRYPKPPCASSRPKLRRGGQ